MCNGSRSLQNLIYACILIFPLQCSPLSFIIYGNFYFIHTVICDLEEFFLEFNENCDIYNVRPLTGWAYLLQIMHCQNSRLIQFLLSIVTWTALSSVYNCQTYTLVYARKSSLLGASQFLLKDTFKLFCQSFEELHMVKQ